MHVVPRARPSTRPRLGSLAERYGLLVAWAAVIVVFTLLRPDTFGTTRNFQVILGSQAALVIVTVGVLPVLATGGFDLSIGGLVTFGASMFAYLDVQHAVPAPLAAVAVLAMAAGVGALNGVLIVRAGLPSLVATLASGTIVAGVALGIVGPTIQAGVDPGFVALLTDRWLGLPRAFFLATALTAVTWYVLEHTPLGRYALFIGGGREVARLAGIRVAAIEVAAFTTAATCAALGGIVVAGTAGSAAMGAGSTFLLPVYAAAFLGATAIRPGQFNAWGAYAAVYFLLTGITGLQLVGAAGWPEQVFYGGALLAAVVLPRAFAHRRATRPTTDEDHHG